MFTKKIHSMLLLAGVLLSLLTVGCAEKINYDTTYEQLIAHFASQGLKVTQVQQLNHYVVGAESAFAFKIGDREIGIYKYNPKLKKHRVRMERVDATKIMYVVGKKFAALRNGSYVMIDYEEHVDRKRIEKAFKSF